MKKKEISKYYLIAFIILVLLLAFFLIRPFIKDLFAAIFISYIFYPVYKRLNKQINSTASALIVCLLVVLLVTLPLIFVLNSVYNEAAKAYHDFRQNPPLQDFSSACIRTDGFICSAVSEARNLLAVPFVNTVYDLSIKKIPSHILEGISEKFFSIPRHLLNIFLIIFLTYYILKDGHKLYDRVMRSMPIKKQHQEILFKSFNDVTYAVIYGHIVVALIQAFLGTIVFILAGVSSPILLGSVMAITALIPYLGAGFVWLPVSLITIGSGVMIQDNTLLIRGIIILVAGIFISTIDNILRPKIIGAKADVHPAIILLGVLGGLTMFGLVGIVIGPVILAASLVMIELYLTKRGVKNEAESKGS